MRLSGIVLVLLPTHHRAHSLLIILVFEIHIGIPLIVTWSITSCQDGKPPGLPFHLFRFNHCAAKSTASFISNSLHAAWPTFPVRTLHTCSNCVPNAAKSSES